MSQEVKELLGPVAVLVKEDPQGVFSVVDGGGVDVQMATSADVDAVATDLAEAIAVGSNPTTAYDGSGGHKALAVATGTALLTKGTAGTDYTLAAPVAGTDDGKIINIISTTAAAHVVTVGAGKINGATNGDATFGGAIGDSVTLVAYNGVWYTAGSPRNVTIS
jgi:co-chaperonin GroES (HSP10)